MAVLVCGGAGYIGSHTVLKLLDEGRDVIIADNFSNSSEKVIPRLESISGKSIKIEKLDLCDLPAVTRLFERYSFDAVMQFAGLKAGGESVEKPLEYYKNNLFSTINILYNMREKGVKNFVFSSSAAVYGAAAFVPITEDFPLAAVNPYGKTKQMAEEILRDFDYSGKDMSIAILRYFNAVGAHPSGLIGEDPSGIPNNLVPHIAQVASGRLEQLPIYGDDYPTRDGTCVRDYVHVEDLAEGHTLALDKLERDGKLVTYNLGTGGGHTVYEVLASYEKACGMVINKKVAPRRPGDVAEIYADPSLAGKELGWRAERSVDDICRDSWNWQKNNPYGY